MPEENPNIRGRFSRPIVHTEVDDEGGADQSARGLADVNRLAAQYELSGVLDQVNLSRAFFADVSSSEELQDHYSRTLESNARFLELDPHIREAAGNSPVRFLEMIGTPEGRKYLEDLGLEFVASETPEDPASAAIANAETLETHVAETAPAAPSTPSQPSDGSPTDGGV